MISDTKETCEECDKDIQKNDYGATLCNDCAAARYWALKNHIRTRLINWYKLPPQKDIEELIDWYNTNYVAGVGFERRLKHALEDRNWFVMRSAGSHGIADLIAIQAGVVLIINCKRDFRDLIKVEPEKVKEMLRVCGNDKYLVPVHARNFNKRTWLTDLRTNRDITGDIFG